MNNTLFNETEEVEPSYKMIGGVLGFRLNVVNKKSRKITSPRTILIEQLMSELEFPHEDFKKILFQTKEMTEDEIREIWQKSRAWKVNSRALMWKLVKEKRLQIKQQLKK